MSRAQADDEFKGATDRFLAWFKAGGGVFRDDLLEIQDLRDKDAGRGISTISRHQIYLESCVLTMHSREARYTPGHDAIQHP